MSSGTSGSASSPLACAVGAAAVSEACVVQQRGAAWDRYRQQLAIAAVTSNAASDSAAAASASTAVPAVATAVAAAHRCHPSREVRARYKLDRAHLGAHLHGVITTKHKWNAAPQYLGAISARTSCAPS